MTTNLKNNTDSILKAGTKLQSLKTDLDILAKRYENLHSLNRAIATIRSTVHEIQSNSIPPVYPTSLTKTHVPPRHHNHHSRSQSRSQLQTQSTPNNNQIETRPALRSLLQYLNIPTEPLPTSSNLRTASDEKQASINTTLHELETKIRTASCRSADLIRTLNAPSSSSQSSSTPPQHDPAKADDTRGTHDRNKNDSVHDDTPFGTGIRAIQELDDAISTTREKVEGLGSASGLVGISGISGKEHGQRVGEAADQARARFVQTWRDQRQ